MPAMVMMHTVDPAKDLRDRLGDLSKIEIFNSQVLVAVYVRPEKTASGLYMTDNHRDEDRHQSKVGLLVKKGSSAFDDPTGAWFKDAKFDLGDWLVYRASDGWSIMINKVLCRIMDDTAVKARIAHPDQVW